MDQTVDNNRDTTIALIPTESMIAPATTTALTPIKLMTAPTMA